MSDAGPGSRTPLPEHLWRLLFSKALLFANKYIQRLRWRGALGGLLPSGSDAESIATCAVLDLVQTANGSLKSLADLDRSSPGGLSISSLPRSISSALSRRVWRHVDRLHHRKENFLLRSEADLAPVFAEDGEISSLVESVS